MSDNDKDEWAAAEKAADEVTEALRNTPTMTPEELAAEWVTENLRRDEITGKELLEVIDDVADSRVGTLSEITEAELWAVTPAFCGEALQRKEAESLSDGEYEADAAGVDESARLTSDDEVEDIDILIAQMEARDRYRFGGITSDDR